MRKAQSGVTFIGWIALMIPVAMVLYAAIRVAPIYLTHMKVASALEQVAKEARDGGTVSPADIRASLEKRFDIEGVEFPDAKDIRVVREGEGWLIQADYERTAPLFGGVRLLVGFDKRETIP